jgi:hypothetical protein
VPHDSRAGRHRRCKIEHAQQQTFFQDRFGCLIAVNYAVVSSCSRMEASRHYFVRRAVEERANAHAARSAEARRAHLELAYRYEKQAADLYEGVRGSTNRSSLLPRPARSGTADTASKLRTALICAFPLPDSGAFPDLVRAIDERAEAPGAAGPEKQKRKARQWTNGRPERPCGARRPTR